MADAGTGAHGERFPERPSWHAAGAGGRSGGRPASTRPREHVPAVACAPRRIAPAPPATAARARSAALAVTLASFAGLATFAVLAALAAPVRAQPAPDVVLPPVEVVGTTPVPGIGLPASRMPGNVQQARAADIDRSHAIDLTDFLNRRLGSVHINEIQNNPFQPDVNYRGFTASPLLGTPQGLSVYVDGVRVNQPFGDVVSWDLIPRTAIASVTLMPGSNPLFGLNTLGGALSVVTKNGIDNPGSSVQLTAGSHGRAAVELETGGRNDRGVDWYVTGTRFHDGGWRPASPTDVRQLFGKLGLSSADSRLSISATLADNGLTGNGLQEQGLLAADRASLYTSPDRTGNRAAVLVLEGRRRLGGTLGVSGNAYVRRIRSTTRNGDVNDFSLDQSVYQPTAAERAVLASAGYTGVPIAGADATNTPFPIWRCLANVLRNDEPAETCTGVLNTTRTGQTSRGASVQLDWDGVLGGFGQQAVVGAALDTSRVAFSQGSELGIVNPDHSVTGVGAFGDGGATGGDVDGEPYDTRVELSSRTRTWSLFATDTVALATGLHLTLSGRYNRSTVTNRDGLVRGGGAGSLDGDHVFSRFNPALGLTWEPTPQWNAYAGIAEGNRAPSAIELGCADPAFPCKLPNAFAGDPPLKQVVTRTVELGLRGGAGSAYRWRLGVFRADNRDDILFVAGSQTGFGNFANVGRTRRQGVEAGFAAQAAAALEVGVDYTLVDATDRSAETVNGSSNSSNDTAAAGVPGVDGVIAIRRGDRLPLVPRHLLKLHADWRPAPAWSVGVDMTATSGAFARGNENNAHRADGVYYLGPGRSAGYAVVNLGVDYRPVPTWALFVQIGNLFDRRYATAAQLGATAFDAAGRFVARPFAANADGERPLRHATFLAPGAPRSVLVGVKVSFD